MSERGHKGANLINVITKTREGSRQVQLVQAHAISAKRSLIGASVKIVILRHGVLDV